MVAVENARLMWLFGLGEFPIYWWVFRLRHTHTHTHARTYSDESSDIRVNTCKRECQ